MVMENSQNKMIVPLADENSNKHDIDYEMKIFRTILKFYGLWTYEKNDAWINTICNIQTSIIFAYLIIICNIPFVSALIKVSHDLMLVADNFTITVPALCVDFKLLIFWIKKKDLAILFREMVKNWCQHKTKNERNIMLKYAKLSRSIGLLGLSSICASVILYSGTFLLFGKMVRAKTNITDISGYILPIQSAYFYDITKGHRYVLTQISQTLYSILGSLFYTTADSLFSIFVLHICGQLEIYSKRIIRIVTTDESSTINPQTLQLLIDEHNDIIRFINIIENVFNLMILTLTFFFAVVFTILALQFISIFTDNTEIVMLRIYFLLIYMIFFLFLMYIYSWVGQCLVDQCENLNRALYECDWYLLNHRQSQQLMMIFLRSQKPLLLTIGKMAPVTLETFLQLMKACAGYVSFLLAVRQ